MDLTAPTLDDLTALALDALSTIPEPFRAKVAGVELRVVELPDADLIAEMGLASPLDLLGLYFGVPFGERGITEAPQDLDRIFLYRQPILDYWRASDEDLASLVRHVLVHEVGHHFGFSDDDMERIEGDREMTDTEVERA